MCKSDPPSLCAQVFALDVRGETESKEKKKEKDEDTMRLLRPVWDAESLCTDEKEKANQRVLDFAVHPLQPHLLFVVSKLGLHLLALEAFARPAWALAHPPTPKVRPAASVRLGSSS